MLHQPEVQEDHKNIVEQGFTLVELLIVIVILGILAGIVVFAVGNLTDSASNTSCATSYDTARTAAAAFKAAHPSDSDVTWGDIKTQLDLANGQSDPKFYTTSATPGAKEFTYIDSSHSFVVGSECQSS